jgi:ubiquitin C-terminal hydrolase
MGHAGKHASESGHEVAINVVRGMIWCYACDRELIDEPGAALAFHRLRAAAAGKAESDEREEIDKAAEVYRVPRPSGLPKPWMPSKEFVTLFTDKARGGHAGLANLGNTCFMNASLQALLHCRQLVRFACSLDMHAQQARALAQRSRDRARQMQLVESFAELCGDYWLGSSSYFVPRHVYRDVVGLNSFFAGFGEHDAQEFVRFFLDSLHEALRVPNCDETSPLGVTASAAAGQAASHSASETLSSLSVAQNAAAEAKVRADAGEADSANKASSSSSSLSSSRATAAAAAAAAAAATSVHSRAADSSPLSANSLSASPTSASPTAKDASSTTDSWARSPLPRRQSVVADVFQGMLLSEVTCSRCGNVSRKRDPFFDLSVEIPDESHIRRAESERGQHVRADAPGRGLLGMMTDFVRLTSPPVTLATCLHAFCTSERLGDRDRYQCERCKQRVDAKKLLSVLQLPEILCVHIKRFSYGSYFSSKVTQQVLFPLRGLDMAPFLARGSEAWQQVADGSLSSLYDMVALVQHSGYMGGGHYTAYCLHEASRRWFEFDDRFVTEVSPETVQRAEAYLLFYQRRLDPKRVDELERDLSRLAPNPFSGEPPLRPLSASEQACFVSRRWFLKARVLGACDPIDNRDLCCEHGVPFPRPPPRISTVSPCAPASPPTPRRDEIPAVAAPASASGESMMVDASDARGAAALGQRDSKRDLYQRAEQRGASVGDGNGEEEEEEKEDEEEEEEEDEEEDEDADEKSDKEHEEHANGHSAHPGGANTKRVKRSASSWLSTFDVFGMDIYDAAVALSKPAYDRLISFAGGGGPLVDGTPRPCSHCEWPRLRIEELGIWRVLEAEKLAHADKEPADGWFYVDASWFKAWVGFLQGGARPGPIPNERLLQDPKSDALRTDLRRIRDYRCVTRPVWQLLLRAYGGGPAIARREM